MDLFKKGVDPVWGEVLCLGERFQIQALTPQNQWPPGLSTLPGFTRSLSTSGQVQCPLPVKSFFFGGGEGGRGLRLCFILMFIELSCPQCLRMAFVA